MNTPASKPLCCLIGAVVLLAGGCTQQEARDVGRWVWPPIARRAPPVPIQPPAVTVPPVAIAPPVAPPPVPRQVVVTRPLPPIVAPRPIVREAKRDRPEKSVKPRQNPPQRAPDNAETMPSCAQVCKQTKGKSIPELIAIGNSMNPSPRLRAHGIACYARCK